MRGTLIALMACVALGSCAAMSAEECAVADWRSIGYQDGAAGMGMLKFADREKACAKGGVTADLNQYQIGRQEGLRSFCVAPSGFRAGLNGYSYQGVCPADLEGDFMLGYQDGRVAHQAQQAEKDARSRLDNARREIERLNEKIDVFAAQARDPKLTAEAREDSRRRANELRDERERAYAQERDADRDLLRAGINLDQTRRDLGMRWGAW
jgi:hypothetical protein